MLTYSMLPLVTKQNMSFKTDLKTNQRYKENNKEDITQSRCFDLKNNKKHSVVQDITWCACVCRPAPSSTPTQFPSSWPWSMPTLWEKRSMLCLRYCTHTKQHKLQVKNAADEPDELPEVFLIVAGLTCCNCCLRLSWALLPLVADRRFKQ